MGRMTSLTALPESFAAGTTVEYTRTIPEHLASDGWTLAVVLSGRDRIAVNGTPSGGAFIVTLVASETTKLRAGIYTWAERATKAGVVFPAGDGSVTVTPDVMAASVGDLQSADEKELELVNAAIEKILGGPQAFSIAGRQVEYPQLEPLQRRKAVLQARIARKKSGGRLGRTHLVTFRGR
jgi:hypothetical protein